VLESGDEAILDEIKRVLRVPGVASDQTKDWIAVAAHNLGERILSAREA
jgi:hypothetical protein